MPARWMDTETLQGLGTADLWDNKGTEDQWCWWDGCTGRREQELKTTRGKSETCTWVDCERIKAQEFLTSVPEVKVPGLRSVTTRESREWSDWEVSLTFCCTLLTFDAWLQISEPLILAILAMFTEHRCRNYSCEPFCSLKCLKLLLLRLIN